MNTEFMFSFDEVAGDYKSVTEERYIALAQEEVFKFLERETMRSKNIPLRAHNKLAGKRFHLQNIYLGGEVKKCIQMGIALYN